MSRLSALALQLHHLRLTRARTRQAICAQQAQAAASAAAAAQQAACQAVPPELSARALPMHAWLAASGAAMAAAAARQQQAAQAHQAAMAVCVQAEAARDLAQTRHSQSIRADAARAAQHQQSSMLQDRLATIAAKRR